MPIPELRCRVAFSWLVAGVLGALGAAGHQPTQPLHGPTISPDSVVQVYRASRDVGTPAKLSSVSVHQTYSFGSRAR